MNDWSTHTQVLDKEIAYLAAPNVEEMAEGIIALAGDAELRKEIGARARQRVHEEYSLPAYARKLGNFYAQLNDKLQG